MITAKWKKVILSTGVFVLVSCIGGCVSLLYWIDSTDRDYWEEFTPQQAAQWVQREPNNISARAVYGMHLWNQKDYDKAIAQFRYEAKLDQKDYSTHYHIAQILDEQGKKEEAHKEWAIVAQLARKGTLVQQEALNK